jgi:ketosteroid isomerase-like protein
MSAQAAAPDREIRQLAAGWQEAVQAKDVARRTAAYAPDAVLFDVIGPLRHAGLPALQRLDGRWMITHEHASAPTTLS